MSQNNLRKEPTLGDPLSTNETTRAKDVEKGVSVRTQQAPAFTFTHIERPFLNQEAAKKSAADTVNTANQAATANINAAVETAEQNVEEPVKTTDSAPVMSGVTAERVIPSPTAATVNVDEQPKKGTKPTKNRRLLIVVLLAILLALVIWLLQPKTPKTLDELQQQQGTNLPIEFRPVDEAEAKRAEEQAMQNAQAQQQAQSAETTPEQPAIQPAPQENAVAQMPTTPTTQPLQVNSVETAAPMPTVQTVSTLSAPAVNTAKEVVTQAPATPAVVRPKTQNSVVYQPEQTKVEPAKAVAVKKLDVEKKVVATKAQNMHQKETNRASVKASEPVVAPQAAASGSVKALTVPKGVSLMQVFRDNQLNISDVNAMSKAAGANGILSNLNAGERLSVRLDSHRRVTEMTLSRGGRFIRQADGSYTFRK